MTTEALEKLKLLTEERDAAGDNAATRMYTDAELSQLLSLHDGDVTACAYDVLLRKAEATGVTLPDGTTLPDQSRHFLRLASRMRRSQTRNMPRADDLPTSASGASAPQGGTL